MSNTTVTVAQTMTASEEFTTAEQPNATSAADRTLKCNSLNLSTTLSSTTTPKVDKPPVYRKITAPDTSIITVDLTAAPCLKTPDSASRAVDMTGAKLTHLQLRAGVGNNATGILIAPGAANPYPLLGTAKSIFLKPGQVLSLGYNAIASNLPAVSATVKNIDITPAAAGDILEIEMALGT